MIFESHAHYDDTAFEQDRHQLLLEMNDNGIEYIINVSSDLESVRTTLEIVENYDFMFAAVGIHPSDSAELDEEQFKWLEEQARKSKVVAIGEIGLDYYWEEPDREVQKIWFIRQLELAKKLKKPVIIHSRDAASDTLSILQSKEAEDVSGVIHCFSYTKETAKLLLEKGYYFGIGGVITFSNAKKLVEAVEYLPIDKILLETDSPYLAPVPNRGKRNSSLNIPYIAEKISEIKKIPYDVVVEQTNKNARELFQINSVR